MAFGDVVQSNSGTSTSATTSPTLGSATTAGNLIVLTFAADDYNGSPNAGWTQSSEMEQQVYHGGYLWWAATTAGMTIPSYTIGSAVRSTWTLVEYEGPFDASPYDTSQGVSVISLANSYTTDSMTPTSGDRLMVAGLNAGNAAADMGAWQTFTNSFTEAKQSLFNGGNPRLTVAQLKRVVTANGSTAYSTGGAHTSGTSNNSEARSALIIAFKKGAAATSIPNKLLIPKQGLVRAAYW